MFSLPAHLEGDDAIIRDARAHPWGMSVRTAMEYESLKGVDLMDAYDVGFIKGINKIYALIRTKSWPTGLNVRSSTLTMIT